MTNRNPSATPVSTSANLAATVASLEKAIADLAREVEATNRRAENAAQVAKQAAALARGSRDVTAEARAARVAGGSEARAARVSGGSEARTRKITPVNVVPITPRVRVGDEGPTGELEEAVLHLIKDRPRLLAELIEETGARQSRISGILDRLQQRHVAVNLGSTRGGRAIWFVPAPETLARLRGG